MSTTAPEPVSASSCWPVDSRCDPEWDTYDEDLQERAQALAVSLLRSLTLHRVGGCPITVRPCTRSCYVSGSQWGNLRPFQRNGQWFNATCGCDRDCGCSTLPRIRLTMPIGRIDLVTIDGEEVDPDAYQIVDGQWLERIDGDAWPTTGMEVTYLNAWPVDHAGAWAAGLLASEFAKACGGGKCRLPSGVTQIVRSGVTMTVAGSLFKDGMTGIREVDAYVQTWNPNSLKVAPSIWAPGSTPAVIRR